MAAGTLAAFVWIWVDNFEPAVNLQFSVFLAAIVTVMAVLMVSNIRYYSPKSINLKGRVPFSYTLGIVLLFVVIAVYPPGVLLLLGIIYGFSGPVQALLRRGKSAAGGNEPEKS